MMSNESSTDSDYARNIEAARAGNAKAQFVVGRCHFQGTGITKSDEEALRWFQLAAAQGDADAQHFLGVLYLQGKGCAQDDRLARDYFQKSAAQAHPSGLYCCALMLLNGRGGYANAAEGRDYTLKAAEAGLPVAQCAMGELCLNGMGGDVDTATALVWFKRSAEAGCSNAMAELGDFYGLGKIVARDPRQAAEWYCKAADAGHALAALILGTYYESGTGVNKDLVKAAQLYECGAKSGIALAHMRLGLCYRYGRGISKSKRVAHEHFLKAKEMDVPGAAIHELLTRDLGLKEILVVSGIMLLAGAVPVLIGSIFSDSQDSIAARLLSASAWIAIIPIYAIFCILIRRFAGGTGLQYRLSDLYLMALVALPGVGYGETIARRFAVNTTGGAPVYVHLWVAVLVTCAGFSGSVIVLGFLRPNWRRLAAGPLRWVALLGGSILATLAALAVLWSASR